MTNFTKYQHVEKLSNYDETEGILNGTVFVQPKIDGFNCCLWLENDEIHCGSRNRELTLDNDHAGFMKYVYENKNKYLNLLKNQFQNCIVYGEWLIKHTIKTYEKEAYNKFYVFDIVSENGSYVNYEEIENACKDYEIDFVPILTKLNNPKVEDILKLVKQNHFLFPDNSFVGEGIVIKNLDFVNRYCRKVWAKIVTSDFKENKHVKIEIENYSLEEEITRKYLTIDIMNKVYAKLMVGRDYWNNKLIPQFLGMVYHDFVVECLWQIVKDKKNPTINFKILQKEVYKKAKEMNPELF